jgi:hypothetical protein
MRKSNVVLATAFAIFWLWASVAGSVTMAEWASSPITVGDQLLTLVSTDWPDITNVSAERSVGLAYAWRLDADGAVLSHETRTVVYKATIIDDPATPEDETTLYSYKYVSLYEHHSPFGIVEYRVDLDDDSDFSSPQVTYLTGGGFGPFPFGGSLQEIYVRLIVEVELMVPIDYVIIELRQAEDPVPVEAANWGSIKTLFR